GVRAWGEPRRGDPGSRRAGRAAGRAHRLRDSGAASRGGRARPGRAGSSGVSVPAAATTALAARDQLTLALDRAAGARPIEGNRLEHHPDSPRALDAMVAAIGAARRWVHFENYIIRDDATGRRFADALAERARAGVAGPAAAALDGAFARIWRQTGVALPPDELDADPASCGDSTVRVVEGVPGRARVYRAVELLAASASERLWITDAYLIAPAPLYASLLDAARGGVDVRLLVPGASDLPVLRN